MTDTNKIIKIEQIVSYYFFADWHPDTNNTAETKALKEIRKLLHS